MKYVLLTLAVAIACMMIVKTSLAAPLSLGFGGRVISTVTPGVGCVPIGIGPVYTTGNIGNPYNAIPFFFINPTFSPSKIPTPGGFVLGNYSTIPSMQYCYTAGGAPFPVKQVTIYGVSR